MILKFPNMAARADFLDRIKVSEVAELVKPSYTQPTVVVVRDSKTLSAQRVEKMLSPHFGEGVEVFQDVAFSVLAPSR